MAYYIRILGTNLVDIPFEELKEVARPALLEITASDVDVWTELTLKHNSGQEIAVIEKNMVVEGELGAEEIKEFLDEVPHYEPASAVAWLQQYLPTVKVIYAFQVLAGTDIDDGWAPLHRVFSAVRNHAGGISQADGEGFSNERGFTILWQFSETATGLWNVGVLRKEGWAHFEMDLGNEEHRKAFRRGEIPTGVKVL